MLAFCVIFLPLFNAVCFRCVSFTFLSIKTLAGKDVSDMIYLVSSGTQNLKSINLWRISAQNFEKVERPRHGSCATSLVAVHRCIQPPQSPATRSDYFPRDSIATPTCHRFPVCPVTPVYPTDSSPIGQIRSRDKLLPVETCRHASYRTALYVDILSVTFCECN